VNNVVIMQTSICIFWNCR